MRTLIVAIVVIFAAVPATAQSRLYTNADLAQTPVTFSRTVPAEELRGFLARQFVYVPTSRRWTDPTIVVIGSAPSDGPFGAFAPPIPDRRLDGSAWSDPAWEQRVYVGYGYRGGGLRGNFQRTDGRARSPRAR
jgi:hypothetical protein